MIKIERFVRIEGHPTEVSFTANKHFAYVNVGNTGTAADCIAELTVEQLDLLVAALGDLADSIRPFKGNSGM